MARIRTVKPEFWQSESMARCSPHARLLAIAVLQLADVAGRFRWISMQVHAHAFPFEEDISVNALADELEAIGYLQRYESDGKTYAFVPGFTDHQRITGKEAQTASRCPAPPDVSRGTKEKQPDVSLGEGERFPEKHLGAQEREREGEPGKEKEIPTTSALTGAPADVSDDEFIFSTGLEYLVKSGESQKSARSFLGRLKRDHGPPKVAQAIDAAMRACAIEPKSYLTKALGAAKANGTTGEIKHWI